jgi:hypothetical protein
MSVPVCLRTERGWPRGKVRGGGRFWISYLSFVVNSFSVLLCPLLAVMQSSDQPPPCYKDSRLNTRSGICRMINMISRQNPGR